MPKQKTVEETYPLEFLPLEAITEEDLQEFDRVSVRIDGVIDKKPNGKLAILCKHRFAEIYDIRRYEK